MTTKTDRKKPTRPIVQVPEKEFEKLADEALDPKLSKDSVTFGTGDDAITVQVRIPKLRAARRIAKLLAPKLSMLQDLAAEAEEGDSSKGFGALAAMGPIVAELADEIHEILGAAFEDQGVTAEWIDEHAELPQVIEACAKLIGKLGLVSLLGKPSTSEGRSS